MGNLTGGRLATTTRRANHPAHDRARQLREQHRRAHRTDRRPAGMRRHTHTNHPARAVTTAGTRVLAASFPLPTLNPELTIRDRNPPLHRTKGLEGAVTLRFRIWRVDALFLRGLTLVRERDNPRIVERAARRNVISICVCAGQMHVVPYHVVRPTIVIRNHDAQVSSAMSATRLNGRVLGRSLSPIAKLPRDWRKKRPSLSGTGDETQSCRY
jgi:hypothetical protein